MENQLTDNKRISLLKKGKKGLFNVIFSRTGLVTLLLLIQVGGLLLFFFWFREWLPHVFGGSVILAVSMVLYILNSDLEPTAKLTWLAIIMAMPVFGSLFYVFTQRDLGHRVLRARLSDLRQESQGRILQPREAKEALRSLDPGVANMARYVRRSGSYPVYQNTSVTYFPSGEEKFQRLIWELEQAEHFIFLEYFIVDEGIMWGRILEILARKAAQGVDVRVMYDGSCEFTLLPRSYPRSLERLGIKCRAFSPVRPFLSTHYNYRDHRKILVIDGHTAFNGGINLADEYINQIVKYGHWKDTAVMLKGEAVKSFTLMFLQMWSIDQRELEFDKFLAYPTFPRTDAPGFVMPYGDSPLDDERVGERVYMDILNRAQRYVHIMSPYLILDSEMESALRYAAQRGVDVRLILPGIPDKKFPYALAKTHFSTLLDSGVKIYLYTPGFLHAKSFVADDREAVVGTINLDYRSLYHHFECATYMYGVDAVGDVEEDFQATMALSGRVTRDTIRSESALTKLTGYLLKVIAPLL